jgi:hypothetical protein
VLATTSSDGVDFYSKEGTFKPELELTTTPWQIESRTLETNKRSWGTITVADFNGDGLDDFFAPHHELIDPDRMFIQRPDGSFVRDFTFPAVDRHGCTAGDVNVDGLIDMYCMAGAHRGTYTNKRNALWMTRPDGTFVNEAALWGVEDRYGRGRRPVLFDFDNDGLLDLYTTNGFPRPDGRRSENILYLNTGKRFVERRVTATGRWGFGCVEAADWDGDGRLDLVVCGSTADLGPIEVPELHLFRNVRGQETERKDGLLGDRVIYPRDATLSDLDGDGREDLVILTRDELQIRLNRGGGIRFSRVDYRLSVDRGMSLAVGDVTVDGHPDIYVVRGTANGRNADDLLLAGPSWLRLKIPQARSGVGTTAEIINVLGRPMVLVINGFLDAHGPVQLIGRFP